MFTHLVIPSLSEYDGCGHGTLIQFVDCENHVFQHLCCLFNLTGLCPDWRELASYMVLVKFDYI